MFPFVSLFTTIGSAIGGLFTMKKSQGDVIKGALKVLGDVNAGEGQREQAIAAVIVSANTSQSWLTRMWRPITMVCFVWLLMSYWYGYVPPNLDAPMPEAVREIFTIIKFGLGGYIGGRTIEKIIDKMAIAKILGSYIKKKLA